MEVKIANKVQSFLRDLSGDRMNNVLVHTGEGQVVHVMKEYKLHQWHKPVVTIAIADENEPHKVLCSASFNSKDKVEMMIKLLESHRDSFGS